MRIVPYCRGAAVERRLELLLRRCFLFRCAHRDVRVCGERMESVEFKGLCCLVVSCEVDKRVCVSYFRHAVWGMGRSREQRTRQMGRAHVKCVDDALLRSRGALSRTPRGLITPRRRRYHPPPGAITYVSDPHPFTVRVRHLAFVSAHTHIVGAFPPST